MSAYFFYPYTPIINPTLNNIYSREKYYYDYEQLKVVNINAKSGGSWKMPYFETARLYESVGGITQFISPYVLEDPYSEYAEKFINFVCMGKVHIESINKGGMDMRKITRPGNKEFIVCVETNTDLMDIEILNSIKEILPPLSVHRH